MATSFHFMGVGGVGMAGLAYLLSRKGHAVTGCDKFATARTRWLEANGIPVEIGHSPDHLRDADRLVITPAVPPDAPERCAGGSRTVFRGELLAEWLNATDGIAVCGTHGKTTTSTFLTRLLQALGADPGWCIGGETGALPVAGTGTGPFVAEADESDGTLARYTPQTLVLNAVDFDHLEHFPSPEAYFDCYRAVLRQTRSEVFVCFEHPRAVQLAREASVAPVRTFGFDRTCDVSAADWPELPRLVHGRHNILNALAAIGVALSRGHSRDEIRAALPQALAELPDRRFQSVAEITGTSPETSVRVITDYAHHPAELACAVSMAREIAPPPRRVHVLFQPHRHSRTLALRDEFPPAFAAADEVTLIPVYAAFEAPLPGGDIADLYAAFRRLHPHVTLARSAEEAWRHAFLTRNPGDVILIAGAGDIVNVLPCVRTDCAHAAPAETRPPVPLAAHSFFRTGGLTYGGSAPVILGQGSNTWISDCATDAELLLAPAVPQADAPPRTFPAGIAGASLVGRADLPDLSFMTGIPGTLGGWTKMNAGAFGHSISEAIESVTLVTPAGERRTVPAAGCGFGYRTSSLEGLIEAVAFRKGDPTVPRGDAAAYRARRKAFPPRTCGSVFKNPDPDRPAGRLLEEAGAKALRVGGAAVWAEHANVIVATEGCTSSDILALARLMARAVFFHSGVKLEPEIRGLEVW